MRAIEIRALNHLRYRREFNSWHTEVKPEYWSHLATRRLWQFLCMKFKSAPPEMRKVSISEMEAWVEAHNFKKKESYWEILARMRKLRYRKKDLPVVTFLQKVRFKDVLEEGISLLGQPDGLAHIGGIRDKIDSLAKLSERKSLDPLDYFRSAKDRTGSTRSEVVPTGVCERFDTLCGGGMGVGELSLYLGATSIGKTAVLCNIAARQIEQGRNVVYFTLDDCVDRAIARRVDQIILGVSEEKILRNPRLFEKKMSQASHAGFGDLLILDYNDRDASVLNLRAAIENMIDDGARVDVVCVDYLDVMVGTDSKDAQKVFLNICRGLRRIGRDYNLRVCTAGQGNRATIDADEIKLSQIAGTISKAKSADVIFGINQNEAQRDEDLLRLTCLKSRVFRRWQEEVFLVADWDTMRLSGLREAGLR